MAKSVLNLQQKQRIYQLKNEDNFSQSKLAELYGVSQSTISNVLKEMQNEIDKKELIQAMENAMVKGVQASIENNGLPTIPAMIKIPPASED